MVAVPSPAIAFVGRHNSGKTTLIEALIAMLSSRGLDVGSIKHHSHRGFEIDYPGKDSYRHRAAGATETVIAAPDQMARVKTLTAEVECDDIVASMPGHDIIIVEGYRKSGLPTIEIMRSGNERDVDAARAFAREEPPGDGAADKLPTETTVAVVTDIEDARRGAARRQIPVFALDDIAGIADFVCEHFARRRLTVVIQAGGESRRMGRSKALVPFDGRPLIERLVRRLEPVADELVITTNEADKLAFLFERHPDVRLEPDLIDVRGALPGLFTALSAATYQHVAVVACDMVFASPALVVGESIVMARTDADVVVPVNKHGFEPFHSLYRRDSCLAALRRALDEGKTKVQSLFSDPDVSVVEFTQKQVLEVEPRGGCFINANTPEELAAIEASYLGE